MSCDNPCQEIVCEVPQDLRQYSLNGLPPNPTVPVPPAPPKFVNEQVEIDHVCPSNAIQFSGVLPSWIQIDQAGNKIIGLAGYITGTTQNNANSNALQALQDFITQQTLAHTMTCGGSI